MIIDWTFLLWSREAQRAEQSNFREALTPNCGGGLRAKSTCELAGS